MSNNNDEKSIKLRLIPFWIDACVTFNVLVDAIALALIYFLWSLTIALAIAGALVTSGCAVLPDTVSLDASHMSHHWGDTRAPYEYGKDTEGISEHWNAGPLKLDLAEYAQQCKDGLHPEFSARASYVIPISK